MEGTHIQLGLCSISEARELVLGRDQERAQSWGLTWRQEQRRQRSEKGGEGGSRMGELEPGSWRGKEHNPQKGEIIGRWVWPRQTGACPSGTPCSHTHPHPLTPDTHTLPSPHRPPRTHARTRVCSDTQTRAGWGVSQKEAIHSGPGTEWETCALRSPDGGQCHSGSLRISEGEALKSGTTRESLPNALCPGFTPQKTEAPRGKHLARAT